MKRLYSNEEIYDLISNGGEDQNLAIKWLYSKNGWASIAKKVLSDMGANTQESDDIIQDGMISFIYDIALGKIQVKSASKSYFIQTCKYRFLNTMKRKQRGLTIVREQYVKEEVDFVSEMPFEKAEMWQEIDAILDRLGKKCKEVLKLWAEGYSHEEIASKIGYESANVSKKTKSLCIKKLKSLGLKKEMWPF